MIQLFLIPVNRKLIVSTSFVKETKYAHPFVIGGRTIGPGYARLYKQQIFLAKPLPLGLPKR